MAAQPGEGGDELSRFKAEFSRLRDDLCRLNREVRELGRRLKKSEQDEEKKELEGQLKKAIARRDLAEARMEKAYCLRQQRENETERAQLVIKSGNTSAVDSEIRSWKENVVEWEEKIKQRQQLLLVIEQDEDWRMNYRKVNWLENVRGVAKAIGSILKHSTSLTCRCQVFMSRETEVGSVVNFSVQGLLYQFQYPPQEIPHNYHYMLHDSGTLPIRVPPGKLCFTLELKEYLIPDKKDEVRFQKAERLTHYYSAQPNFDIDLNKKSKTRLKEGAVIANFSVSNDDGLVYECDLIKPSQIEVSDRHQPAPSSDVITVFLPSLTATTKLGEESLRDITSCLWPARFKWRHIGDSLKIDPSTLEVIGYENRRVDDCFVAVLLKWLRRGKPVPCWKVLAEALSSPPVGVIVEESNEKDDAQSKELYGARLRVDENKVKELADEVEKEWHRLNDEWSRLIDEVKKLEQRLKESKQDEEKKELEGQLKKTVARRDLAGAKANKAYYLWEQRKKKKERAELVIKSGDTSKVDSEIRGWKENVVVYEEKIKQQQQLLLEIEQDEENVQLLNEALKEGYIDCDLVIAILVGPAGVGKTCLLHLLLGKNPPPIRTSTGVAESPIAIQVRAVSATKIELFLEGRWQVVDADNMLPKLAHFIAKRFAKSDVRNQSAPLPKEVEEYLEQLGISTTSDSDHSSDSYSPVDSFRATLPPPSPSRSQPAAVKAVIGAVMDKLLKLMSRENLSEGDQEEFSTIWVYITDCGGQPQFHELFPLFIRGVSVVMFVSRLSDRLEDLPSDEFYQKGELVGSASSTQLTTEDQVKCMIRSFLSQSSDFPLPKVIFVGTHLDRIKECSESLDEKNKKLLQIFGPEFREQFEFYDRNKLIYPLNTLGRGKDEEKVADSLRSAIQKATSRKVKIPICWYILEIVLQDLASKLGTRMLQKSVCLEIAYRLNFTEKAFNAALKFFHDLNILKYSDALPEIVFVDSQVPLDKLSELVQHSYFLLYGKCLPGDFNEKWRQFCEEGVITIELLRKFERHYVPGLFECEDFMELLKKQLVVVPLSEEETTTSDPESGEVVKYFMPTLLKMLLRAELEEHRVFTSAAAPLLFRFSHGCRRSGIFGCLIVHLMKRSKWKIQYENGGLIFVARNCVTFRPYKNECYVTVIDAFFYIEVHINAPPQKCEKHCPTIRQEILDGISAACKVLTYTEDHPHLAFFCPHSGKVEEKTKKERHAASISEDGNDCSCTETTHFFQLEKKHKIWLGGQECVEAMLHMVTTSGRSQQQHIPCHPALHRPIPAPHVGYNIPPTEQSLFHSATSASYPVPPSQPLFTQGVSYPPLPLYYPPLQAHVPSHCYIQSSVPNIASTPATSAQLNLPIPLVSAPTTTFHSITSSSVSRLLHIPEYNVMTSGVNNSRVIPNMTTDSTSLHFPYLHEAQYTLSQSHPPVVSTVSHVKYPMEIPEFRHPVATSSTNLPLAGPGPQLPNIPYCPPTQLTPASAGHPKTSTESADHYPGDINQAVKRKSDMPDTCKNQKIVKSGQITDPDRLFSDIANYIYDNYINIGIELGLKYNVLKNELETGRMRTLQGSKKALKMLQLWRESVKEDDLTYSVLAAALEKHGFGQCADKYCYTELSSKKQHIPKGYTNPAMASQVPPFSSVPSYPTTQISTGHATDLSLHSTGDQGSSDKSNDLGTSEAIPQDIKCVTEVPPTIVRCITPLCFLSLLFVGAFVTVCLVWFLDDGTSEL